MKEVQPTTTEVIRSEEQLNKIIDEAIEEVLTSFAGNITERDRSALEGLVMEKQTEPLGKIKQLRVLTHGVGVSDNMKGYVNNILLTLQANFSAQERGKCVIFGTNILEANL